MEVLHFAVAQGGTPQAVLYTSIMSMAVYLIDHDQSGCRWLHLVYHMKQVEARAMSDWLFTLDTKKQNNKYQYQHNQWLHTTNIYKCLDKSFVFHIDT